MRARDSALTDEYGLDNQTTQIVDATSNYWGSATPHFVPLIFGSVTHDPYFTNSSLTIRSDATTVPDSSGHADINVATPQLIVTSSTQPVTVTVASGTVNASINFSSFITGNTGTIPQTTVNTAGGNISIPASTTVTATGGNWDGVINAPTIKPNTSVSIPTTTGSTTTVATVIDVGSDSVSLTFDKAVRLFIPGQAGKLVGFVRNSVFTQISTPCSADTQAAGDALTTSGNCYVTVGSDMVIWTKHFTTFVTYVQNQTTPAQTYTVVAGDTLSSIGAQTSTDWQLIASTNGINAPYTIYPGQVLQLPANTVVSSSTTTTQSSTPAVLGATSNPQISTAISTVVDKTAIVAPIAKKANWFSWNLFYAGAGITLATVIYYVYRAAGKQPKR